MLKSPITVWLPSPAKNIDAELDSAVGEAVFTVNEGMYLDGELETEGHVSA